MSTKTLEDQGNNPKYKQLTPALLAAEPDSSLEWAIMQHVAWTINQDYAREREIVGGLSPGVRMVYTTHWVEAEVSTGRLADIALAGFEALGAAEHERLMRQALVVYERVRPQLDKAREAGTVEAFSGTYADSAFAALDQQFYDLDTDLSKLRIRYIREHPGQFAGPWAAPPRACS